MRNLKRALSMLLTSTMVLGMMVMGSNAAGYKDVDASKNNVEAIEVLQAVSIMSGVDDAGNFDPNGVVTRNQIAVIMANLMAYNVATYAGTSPFTDVPSWAEPYVAACWTNGITAGISDTLYGGDQTVTTAQAALMIMKALGYFQYSSDFGSDWQLSTVSQGNKIDLFNGVNSGVKEAMTRNDVAQLVLNGLKSGMVEAETNGTITVGDTTIVNGVQYNYVTSAQDYASAISDLRPTSSTSATVGSIVELGEKLYQGALTLDSFKEEGNTDVFGRPANTWEYQAKEIGTYSQAADASFTGKVTPKALYDAVGRTATENYSWNVYVDGDLKVSTNQNGWAALNSVKTDNVGEVLNLTLAGGQPETERTGNGVRTEVFVDGTNKLVNVSVTHYYAAEVYEVESDYITLSDLGAGPVARDDEFETTDFSEDQIVVYSYVNGEIQEVIPATKMEGTITATRVSASDSDGDYYTVDGTKYNYNLTVPGDDRLVTENVNNDMVGYLDQYGYAIYIDEAAISYDYAYVLSMGNDGDIYGGGADTYYARLVLTDGTVVKAETDEDDKSLENHIVAYTVDKNGVYTLSDRSGALAAVSSIDVDNGIASFEINGDKYTANSNTVFIVGESAANINDYDFTVYTGVKNMPNITIDANAKFAITTEANSTVAKVVYIQDADVSGAGSVYFVRANTGAKLVNDSELGRYREIDAVVDGEVTTLKVKEGSSAEAVLCGLSGMSINDGLWLNADGTQRIVALESITTNADGLVTSVRLYDGINAQGDGYLNVYNGGTDKAVKETVELGGLRYAWYDDVAVVRWNAYSGSFSVSTINSVKEDSNDRAVAVLADNVLNGLCIVEYRASGDTIPAQPALIVAGINAELAKGDYTYNGTLTLDGDLQLSGNDLTVNGDLYLNGKTVSSTPAGGTINVTGTLYMGSAVEAGVTINAASAVVLGDVTMNGTVNVTGNVTKGANAADAFIEMNQAGASLTVGGDMTANLNAAEGTTAAITGEMSGTLYGTGTVTDKNGPVTPDSETDPDAKEFQVTVPAEGVTVVNKETGAAITTGMVAKGTVITVTPDPEYTVKVGVDTITAATDYTVDKVITITATKDEKPPISDLEYAPGTVGEIDTTKTPNEVTVYHLADATAFTAADIVKIVTEQTDYAVTAATGSDSAGWSCGNAGSSTVVCKVVVKDVVALSVEGEVIAYALEDADAQSIDLSKYVQEGKTFIKLGTSKYEEVATNSKNYYSWDPTTDGTVDILYGYAYSDADTVIAKVEIQGETADKWTDISSTDFVPCDATLKLTGATSTKGQTYQLVVGGKNYGDAVEAKDTTALTYTVTDLGSYLDKDGKVYAEVQSGYEVSLNGKTLTGLFAGFEAKAVTVTGNLTDADLGTYVLVTDADSLVQATAPTTTFELKKETDASFNDVYTLTASAQVASITADDLINGVYTLMPVAEVTLGTADDTKMFAKVSANEIFNEDLAIMGDNAEIDLSSAAKLYVVVGTEFQIVSGAESGFGTGSLKDTDSAKFTIAIKDKDGKYTTVNSSYGDGALTATVTIDADDAVTLELVTSTLSDGTWSDWTAVAKKG